MNKIFRILALLWNITLTFAYWNNHIITYCKVFPKFTSQLLFHFFYRHSKLVSTYRVYPMITRALDLLAGTAMAWIVEVCYKVTILHLSTCIKVEFGHENIELFIWHDKAKLHKNLQIKWWQKVKQPKCNNWNVMDVKRFGLETEFSTFALNSRDTITFQWNLEHSENMLLETHTILMLSEMCLYIMP